MAQQIVEMCWHHEWCLVTVQAEASSKPLESGSRSPLQHAVITCVSEQLPKSFGQATAALYRCRMMRA